MPHFTHRRVIYSIGDVVRWSDDTKYVDADPTFAWFVLWNSPPYKTPENVNWRYSSYINDWRDVPEEQREEDFFFGSYRTPLPHDSKRCFGAVSSGGESYTRCVFYRPSPNEEFCWHHGGPQRSVAMQRFYESRRVRRASLRTRRSRMQFWEMVGAQPAKDVSA